MVNQSEIAKYVRQAGKECPAPYRRKLITELQNNLSDFLEDNPEYTMKDVMEHFGSPEKFSDECLLAMDEAGRRNILSKTRWIKKVVCVGIATAVLIIAIAAIWIVSENSQSAAHYYYEEIIELKK